MKILLLDSPTSGTDIKKWLTTFNADIITYIAGTKNGPPEYDIAIVPDVDLIQGEGESVLVDTHILKSIKFLNKKKPVLYMGRSVNYLLVKYGGIITNVPPKSQKMSGIIFDEMRCLKYATVEFLFDAVLDKNSVPRSLTQSVFYVSEGRGSISKNKTKYASYGKSDHCIGYKHLNGLEFGLKTVPWKYVNYPGSLVFNQIKKSYGDPISEIFLEKILSNGKLRGTEAVGH